MSQIRKKYPSCFAYLGQGLIIAKYFVNKVSNKLIATLFTLHNMFQALDPNLEIGHTYLTHSYLLKNEDPPICIPCHSLLTVELIVISCIDFDIIRQNFYTASNLKDLFHNIHPKRIISFVHASGLTNKL